MFSVAREPNNWQHSTMSRVHVEPSHNLFTLGSSRVLMAQSQSTFWGGLLPSAVDTSVIVARGMPRLAKASERKVLRSCISNCWSILHFCSAKRLFSSSESTCVSSSLFSSSNTLVEPPLTLSDDTGNREISSRPCG